MLLKVRNQLAQLEIAWRLRAEKDEWRGDIGGLQVILRRHPRGRHWCGWVEVPSYHKWHGKSIHSCVKWPQCLPKPVPEDLPAAMRKHLPEVWECEHRLKAQLQHVVHGGVTGAGKLKKEASNSWWLAFDCGHQGDLSPAMLELKNISAHKLPPYRTLAYAKREAGRLAAYITMKGANA